MDRSTDPATPVVDVPEVALPELAAVAPKPTVAAAWHGLLAWPGRRWLAALGGGLATVLVIGVSTAMIPNPVFGRSIETTDWAWPVLVVTAVLAGLLGATYVRGAEPTRSTSRSAAVGGLLSYFAVGCPVCNKIALLALGYTGALQWFAPVQPYLGAAGLVLLGYALHRRLLGEVACPAPVRA